MYRKPANCRLFNADCIKAMAALPDQSVHAVLTDHPYGSTDCTWDKRVDLAAWWEQVDRITTESAIVASFACQPFATDLINSRRKSFRYELVWDKVIPVGFLNANRQPMRAHELILVFCRKPGQSTYNPQFNPGLPYKFKTKVRGGSGSTVYRTCGAASGSNPGRRHPTSILRFQKPTKQRLHPTEKPTSLLSWMVLSWTRPGTTILDPFMGSGSTGESALNHGRKFIGIEMDQAIFQVAALRLRAFNPIITNLSDVL